MNDQTVKGIYKKYSNKLPVMEIGAGWWSLFEFEHVCFDKAFMINGTKTCANHFGDFHDMSDFKDNTFAFICALNVIEHAKHPETALKEWCRILQQDGILLLDWPAVGFTKPTLEELKKFELFEKLLSARDINSYVREGGNMSWVSKDKNNNYFLDAHYSMLSLEEMKQILPKEFTILEEDPPYGFLVLKKEAKSE
jgi:ubiquinone/menaquinone biosynthesis C-methylase UbiE